MQTEQNKRKGLLPFWRDIAREAGKLLFPPACAVCDELLRDRHALVCASCLASLPWVEEPVCMVCGRPLQDMRKEKCSACETRQMNFDVGKSTFLYKGGIREAVLRMKFSNRRDHLDFFAWSMARVNAGWIRRMSPAVFVPVPMHRKKRRERGYDQCALLTDKLSRLTGVPVAGGLLERVRYTRPQKGLNARERVRNLQGAFRVSGTLPAGRTFILVDDIYTTGTTIDEAARVLKAAGAEKICCLTLCTQQDAGEV